MAVQAVGIALFHLAGPGLEVIRRNDSRSYIALARGASPIELLGSIRTPGYPLFLRAVDSLGEGLAPLPAIQLVLYLAAAVALCAALERFGLAPLAAVAGASPLLYSPLVPHLAPSIMTDVPAATLAVTCVALWLWMAAAGSEAAGRRAPSDPPAWRLAALGTALFLSYLVRPAYLFLVAYLPLAALAPAQPAGPGDRRRAVRLAVRLAVVALLPLLAYCTVRWVAVGHFAPASFTGHNLTGIAASTLDPAGIDRLPDRHRRLARTLVENRPLRHLQVLDARSPYEDWRVAYIKNSWRIAVPAARETWAELPADATGRRAGRMPRAVWVDRYLTSWSLAVIAERPGLYLVWLARAAAAAGRSTLADPWVWAPALVLLLALALARDRSRRRSPPVAAARAFFGLTLGYYLASLLLILPVEPPEWRYLTAAELLLPGGLAAWAVSLLCGAGESRT